MLKMKITTAFGILSVLAACSGGSGGSGDNPVAEYTEDSARAVNLVNELSTMRPTGSANMPDRGRAEYDGVVGMAFGAPPASPGDARMIGDLSMDADFTTSRITGEMDDFNTRNGQEVDGELRITNGRINGSGFSSDISGRLTGGSRSPGNVSGSISGEFFGNNAEAIAGTGTATSDEGDLGLTILGREDPD